MLGNIVPRFMKNLLRILTLATCGFTGIAFAGDFKGVVIASGDTLTPPIHVSGDQFLVIRNFTQDSGSTRGLVNVYQIATGQSANVLAATIIDQNNPPALEVINNVVIAGPANVTVSCGDGTNCFLTYRKESN
jgi:hypothetical protein